MAGGVAGYAAHPAHSADTRQLLHRTPRGELPGLVSVGEDGEG